MIDYLATTFDRQQDKLTTKNNRDKLLVYQLFILKFVDVLCNALNLYLKLPQKLINVRQFLMF